MLGPIYTCISCHMNMFKTNVRECKQDLLDDIDSQIPLQECIADLQVFTRLEVEYSHLRVPAYYKLSPDYTKHRFICTTCLTYLKRGKLPPVSVMNQLGLHQSDKQLKEENLNLTELEASLISPSILFEKIYQLPKSLWTGVKGKIVNVPITSEATNSTLEQLPRTPAAAGLIGVALKRKKEMKNTHLRQFVNTDKMFHFLNKVKAADNPHFQEISCPNEYKARCKAMDANGYSLIFQDLEDDELLETFDAQGDSIVNDELDQEDCNNNKAIEAEEEDTLKKLEFLTTRYPTASDAHKQSSPDDVLEDFKAFGDINVEDALSTTSQSADASQKDPSSLEEDNSTESNEDGLDPVKKTQFVYDESVCMAPKYLEITVAPGEGQKPKNRMTDKHWDVKAFPQLHNLDGSNGKDQERKVKLTDQRYFVQRVLNKETRFAKCPSYLYAAVGFLEEKHIYNSLSLAGTRGHRVETADGKAQFNLEDECRVIESVPMSPKYWNRIKYEVLAKLDNFGPFQLFFTLSCADMRWEANFITILLEKGYEINMRIEQTGSEWKVVPEARTPNGVWKPIDQFIKEDVDESFHELIRGNVVMATR